MWRRIYLVRRRQPPCTCIVVCPSARGLAYPRTRHRGRLVHLACEKETEASAHSPGASDCGAAGSAASARGRGQTLHYWRQQAAAQQPISEFAAGRNKTNLPSSLGSRTECGALCHVCRSSYQVLRAILREFFFFRKKKTRMAKRKNDVMTCSSAARARARARAAQRAHMSPATTIPDDNVAPPAADAVRPRAAFTGAENSSRAAVSSPGACTPGETHYRLPWPRLRCFSARRACWQPRRATVSTAACRLFVCESALVCTSATPRPSPRRSLLTRGTCTLCRRRYRRRPWSRAIRASAPRPADNLSRTRCWSGCTRARRASRRRARRSPAGWRRLRRAWAWAWPALASTRPPARCRWVRRGRLYLRRAQA